MTKYFPVLMLAVLLFIAWRQQWWMTGPKDKAAGSTDLPAGLDRKAPLVFTRHARCRMQCRQVTEQEIREILAEGHINREKSDPGDRPCPTYALEGYSHEGQHLRVVFATCDNAVKVVTCIDLDKDWACRCN